MRTRTLATSAAALALLAIAAAPSPAQETLAERAARITAASRAADPRVDTLRTLTRQRISLEAQDARLEDVLTFIEQAGNLTFDVRWINDREPIGLDPDAQVTLAVENLPILTVLERVLARTGDDFLRPTWQLDESGMVEIGPREILNRRAFVRFYDIQDMLVELPDFPDVPELDLDAVLQQTGQRGGGGGGGNIFQDNQQANDREGLEARADELITIVTEIVEPDQWIQNGGSGASIRYYRGKLLVRAPDYIHRQIGGYEFWPQARR